MTVRAKEKIEKYKQILVGYGPAFWLMFRCGEGLDNDARKAMRATIDEMIQIAYKEIKFLQPGSPSLIYVTQLARLVKDTPFLR